MTLEVAAAELVHWYTSHSLIRRLWAIEEVEALRVVVTLEPTPDGDNVEPAWLANSQCGLMSCNGACTASYGWK